MNPSLATILQRIDDPAFLHASTSFTEALARLHFAAHRGRGLVALVGPDGAGKSTLLRRFRRELASMPACLVHIALQGLNESDLRTAIAEQLGLRARPNWHRLAERLIELGYEETPLVLLADDAGKLSTETSDLLARLWEIDPRGQTSVLMVLATDELALAQWPDGWLDRVDLRVDVQRWSAGDVADYLIAIVGDERKRNRGFEPEAMARIHEISGGLPRLVQRVAQLALLAAEDQQRTIIDDATVTGVSHELMRVSTGGYDQGTPIEFIDDHEWLNQQMS
jgi:type II secretory pathway predicted ATPase ExeA